MTEKARELNSYNRNTMLMIIGIFALGIIGLVDGLLTNEYRDASIGMIFMLLALIAWRISIVLGAKT